MQIDDNESDIRADVGVVADDADGSRAAEDAVRIERDFAFQKVIGRIAVEQRSGTDGDQALFAIGDVEVGIHGVDGLLFVFGVLLASRIGSGRGGCGDSGGVFRRDVKLLAQR